MQNLMTGGEKLSERVFSAVAVPVAYERNGVQLFSSLPAKIGKCRRAKLVRQDITVRIAECDFIVSSESFLAVAGFPKKGDVILKNGRRYAVSSFDRAAHSYEHDPIRAVQLRIHTAEVANE